MKEFKQPDFEVTNRHDMFDVELGITPEIRTFMEEMYYEVPLKKKITEAKLLNLIAKYPQIPQFKNHLSAYYSHKKNKSKAFEINQQIIKDHPDYLFGKINLAHEYIMSDQPDKVPEAFNGNMDLKSLYPQRNIFHELEVLSFYKILAMYYIAIKDFETADDQLRLLEKFDLFDETTENLQTQIFAHRFIKNTELWKAEIIDVAIIKDIPNSKQKNPPVFTHPEINFLYEHGLNIPSELLKKILALPCETVISDLEKVLKDATDRYQHFNDQKWDEEKHHFLLHAIFLLAELKSDKSLPKILDFLENHKDVLELWLGDHITSTLWLAIYKLAPENLNLLKQFLMKPGIYTYSKTSVSDALCQLVIHNPEKRNDVLKIFRDVFLFFINTKIDENIIDSDLIGLAIGDVIDCDLFELLPEIKELHNKKYVSTQINGTYEDVESFFKNQSKHDKKNEIYSICELYDHVISTWAGYNDYKENEFIDNEENIGDYTDVTDEPYVASPKIGRNDPCPCGSGKKYKKCCLK